LNVLLLRVMCVNLSVVYLLYYCHRAKTHLQ
jgi:hypothetical protein